VTEGKVLPPTLPATEKTGGNMLRCAVIYRGHVLQLLGDAFLAKQSFRAEAARIRLEGWKRIE